MEQLLTLMKVRDARAIGAVIALNLGLFILVTSVPAFQSAHHHWIFPALAALLAIQWALSFGLRKAEHLLDQQVARATVVSALAFLIVMAIVRHATILACFDQCAFKLAGMATIAGAVFLAQRGLNQVGFWDALRSSLVGIGALLWAVYLMLRGLQLAPWAIDLGFAIGALVFWLGRTRAVFLIPSLGICAGLAIRATANEFAIIGLGVLWSVVVPLAAAHRVEAWLERRAEERMRSAGVPRADEPPWKKVALSAGRIAVAVAVTTLRGSPSCRRHSPSKTLRRSHPSHPDCAGMWSCSHRTSGNGTRSSARTRSGLGTTPCNNSRNRATRRRC